MIRVGIVGAGENTRLKHLPGLQAIAGVEIVGVVNRTAESTARVAAAFHIPRQFPSWTALVEDPNVDAVVIGTWPDLHAEVTCAALAAGKHVLTEARMARNLAEAQQMVLAAANAPQQVAMLVPSPLGLSVGSRIAELVSGGYLGDLREVVVIGADDQFHDYSRPLHWRQDILKSGLNVLTLGILHETATRWVPVPEQVFALTQVFEAERRDPTGSGTLPVTVPDHVAAVTTMPGGARGLYHLSGVTLFGAGKQIHLYGSTGAIKVTFGPGTREQAWAARIGDAALRELEIPPERRGRWRVEAEFIAAIRGEEPVRLNTFAIGLHGMAFTEAVARSAATGQMVSMPLAD